MNSKILGDMGESKVFVYLREHGYILVEKNYVCPIGEIDIIAKHDGMIVFVEVKTRSSKKFGLPRETVGFQKQQKLRNLAMYYLKATKNFNTQCRFDIAEVLGDEITLIQNAF